MNSTTYKRTRTLMSLPRALAFRNFLAARGQCADLQVRETRRAKAAGKTHFVSWTPKSVRAHRALLAAPQRVREERAAERADSYHFEHVGGAFYMCRSERSGRRYETSVCCCTCPDYQYRLKGSGLRCAHSIALEMHLTEEAERRTPEQREEEAAEEDEVSFFGCEKCGSPNRETDPPQTFGAYGGATLYICPACRVKSLKRDEQEAADEFTREGYEQAEREAWEGQEWQHLASRADGKSEEYRRRLNEDFPLFD